MIENTAMTLAMLSVELIPTRIISSVIFWTVRRWKGGQFRIMLVHVISLLIAIFLVTFGRLPIESGVVLGINMYLIPQTIWLIYDMIREWRTNKDANEARNT